MPAAKESEGVLGIAQRQRVAGLKAARVALSDTSFLTSSGPDVDALLRVSHYVVTGAHTLDGAPAVDAVDAEEIDVSDIDRSDVSD